MRHYQKLLTTVTASLLLAACSSPQTTEQISPLHDGAPATPVDVSKIPNAVPVAEPLSKRGNPPSYKALGKTYYVLRSAQGYNEKGIASWYGTKFHNKITSSGEVYDMYAMTAASPDLPLPTFVRVTNLNNGKSVIVKVNDRGPFKKNRIIDLSYAAAVKLGYADEGTALVQVTAIIPRGKDGLPETEINLPHTIFVQAGAFDELSNAQLLEKQLTTLTKQPVRIKSTVEKQRTIYRVQVGPLANVAISDKVNEQLEKAGITSPLTVVD